MWVGGGDGGPMHRRHGGQTSWPGVPRMSGGMARPAGCLGTGPPPGPTDRPGRRARRIGRAPAIARQVGTPMQVLYFVLAAVHIVAVAVTGILWTTIILMPKSRLRPHLR